MKSKFTYALIATVFTALAFWIYDSRAIGGLVLHRHNEANRSALLQIREAIPLGATSSDVLAAYGQYRTKDLQLLADSPPSWEIRMPLEWGARDWNLHLAFEARRVSAVRIRTSDGPAPKDGPPDKQP